MNAVADSTDGIHVQGLPSVPDLLALHATDPAWYPMLLQSAASGTPRARYDLLLAAPSGGLRLAGGQLEDLDGHPLPGTFLDALDRVAAAADPCPRQPLPFIGGYALLLGYELAAEIEPRLRRQLPAAPPGPPTALALRCHAAVIVDHAEGSARLVCEPGHEAALARIQRDLAGVHDATALPPLPAFRVEEDAPARFLDGVDRIHGYLAAGDVFQVNLSRGWRAIPDGAVAPPALHAALRRANPAPFAGLFAHDGWAVASSSPERLLAVDGRRIETRPIAGTRARAADPVADRAQVAELIAHPKERAEHVMLIDLERNDLGRVCEPGSVRVEELMAVESYAHVHHIESTVAGRLRADVGPGAAIGAVFPGGTITGCPKVRCMEIIAELEGEGRGAYTGAMGYLSRDGRLDLNILIRTLVWDGSVVRLRAGAGIVADSDAAAELAETRAKARGLLRALGAVG